MNTYDEAIQPLIVKKNPFATTMITFLISIIPFGVFYTLYLTIHDFTAKKVRIVDRIARKVPDRRYKTGYRVEGYKRVKTNRKRELEGFEIEALRYNAKFRAVGVGFYFLFGIYVSVGS